MKKYFYLLLIASAVSGSTVFAKKRISSAKPNKNIFKQTDQKNIDSKDTETKETKNSTK